MRLLRPLRFHSLAPKIPFFIATVVVLRITYMNAVNYPSPNFERLGLFEAYPSVPADLEVRAGALRMMVVGDSLSQGFEGDHTWRYHIWQWFKSQGLVVDFVGPFLGTRPQAITVYDNLRPEPVGIPPIGSPAVTTGGYAIDTDPEFNPRHFAAVGRAAWEVPRVISAMVLRYQPDYLLILLGYNDLAWNRSISDMNGNPYEYLPDISEVLNNIKEVVEQARVAKPNLRFAIGDVPQRMPTFQGLPERTDAYNKLLAETLPTWSSETSQAELVHIRECYQCGNDICPAGFDGLHPNMLGEYQIAQAFSRALVQGFKLGATELAVPVVIPPRASSIPKQLKAVSGKNGVNVTWDAVYGAKEYEVQYRIVGKEWTLSPHIQPHQIQYPWVNETIAEMDFRVRMSSGDEKGAWSPVIGICQPWRASTNAEVWSLRWWYRKYWVCQ